MEELRVSGMNRIDNDVLATLSMDAPLLEVLDLTYIRDLHNSARETFGSCSDDGDTQFGMVLLTYREAGRDTTASTNCHPFSTSIIVIVCAAHGQYVLNSDIPGHTLCLISNFWRWEA